MGNQSFDPNCPPGEEGYKNHSTNGRYIVFLVAAVFLFGVGLGAGLSPRPESVTITPFEKVSYVNKVAEPQLVEFRFPKDYKTLISNLNGAGLQLATYDEFIAWNHGLTFGARQSLLGHVATVTKSTGSEPVIWAFNYGPELYTSEWKSSPVMPYLLLVVRKEAPAHDRVVTDNINYYHEMEHLTRIGPDAPGSIESFPCQRQFIVNYDLARADALALGKFHDLGNMIKLSHFPIGEGTGKKTLTGDLVHLGVCYNDIDTDEALAKLSEELKKRGPGWRPMTVREFSAFVGAYPELCKEKFIGVLGSIGKSSDIYDFQEVAIYIDIDNTYPWHRLFQLTLYRFKWNSLYLFAVVHE